MTSFKALVGIGVLHTGYSIVEIVLECLGGKEEFLQLQKDDFSCYIKEITDYIYTNFDGAVVCKPLKKYGWSPSQFRPADLTIGIKPPEQYNHPVSSKMVDITVDDERSKIKHLECMDIFIIRTQSPAKTYIVLL